MSNGGSKEFVKTGMVVSLLAVAGTAFFQNNKKAKCLHVVSGVALVGFSYWHHSLYKKEHGKLKKETKSPIQHIKERG